MNNLKLFSIVLVSFLVVIFACSQESGKSSIKDSDAPLVVDSTKILHIDSMCAFWNSEAGRLLNEYSFKYKIYNDSDDIRVFEYNSEVARVVANYYQDTAWMRNVFYLKDGQLFFVRYRKWFRGTPSWSKEVISYLENGEIFCAFERKADLLPDQPPAAFLIVPIQLSTRSRKEIANEYNLNWEPTKKAIETYRASMSK